MRINKMTATIKTMKLSYADLLSPNQLMEGDLINVDNDIVKVISIVEDAAGDNYVVTYQNDFEEQEEIIYNYEDKINLYVFVEENE
jgi:gamma-glutamylcyclotransferase (GGCT)/AIG2-like uncharacterized protein YtfP